MLLLLLLTGSGIVFYDETGSLLNGLLSDRAPTEEGPPTLAATRGEAGRHGSETGGVQLTAVTRTDGGAATSAGAALIATATDAFPGGRVVFYYPPGENGIHGFRIRQPCETHPNGRSYLYARADGTVLRTVSACRQPAGQRALYAVYPLHAGKLDSEAYRLLVFLGGLVLTLISATGAAAYVAKLTGRR